MLRSLHRVCGPALPAALLLIGIGLMVTTDRSPPRAELRTTKLAWTHSATVVPLAYQNKCCSGLAARLKSLVWGSYEIGLKVRALMTMGGGTRSSDCDTKEQDTKSHKKLTAGGAARAAVS
jgi:hypothetical protein